MAVIRGKTPESNFYILDKAISEDGRLSWDERGLLIYLLGKPESWRVSVGHLIKQTENSDKKVGKARVYAMLSALEDAGYVRRQDARDGNGKYIGIDYVVSPICSENEEKRRESVDMCDTEREAEPEEEESTDLFGAEHPVDRKTCPWEAILDKWAEIMPDKQQPSKNMWQGTSRANDLAQRWKACFSIKHESTGKPFYTTTEEGIEWWGRFFAYMRKSDFLMGKTGNARWFKLDWVVKKSNFVKIMEKHYHQ